MKWIFLLPLASCLTLRATAQISGNQAYKDRYSPRDDYSRLESPKAVFLKDSVLQVSADILFKAKADTLVVTLGLNQEETTVAAANAAINRRLETFRNGLRKLGVPENHSYVDFVAQTKIYDYNVDANRATQFIKGFEIKKNVSVKLPAVGLFDNVVELAAQGGIYDVIKVDYVVSEPQRVYEAMLSAAAEIIRRKKENYLRLSPVAVSESGKISSETFFAVYPSSQYKEYQAFETSDVTASDRTLLIQTLARKNKTFYYDGIDRADFDRIVNDSSPVVGVQYVLRVVMEYGVKKENR